MEVVDIWTGQRATALRTALRMTSERFAQHLGTAVRTVAKWNAQPDVVPVSELQRALDTALSRASAEERARFAILASTDRPSPLSKEVPPQRAADSGGADLRLAHDPAISDALHWLDSRMGWPEGEARHRVRAALRTLDDDSLQNLAHRRGSISQSQSASALSAYYGTQEAAPYRFYSARCDGVRRVTSVLTKIQWLDLGIALGQGKDRMALSADVPTASGQCGSTSRRATPR